MLNLDSIVSYREDIDTTDIDEDKVMMDLEKGQYFALNSVGSRIWEEIQSPVKISEVVNILLSEYDVDRETCEKSVMEFIDCLLYTSWINMKLLMICFFSIVLMLKILY